MSRDVAQKRLHSAATGAALHALLRAFSELHPGAILVLQHVHFLRQHPPLQLHSVARGLLRGVHHRALLQNSGDAAQDRRLCWKINGYSTSYW